MKQNINEVEINGAIYVQKDTIKNTAAIAENYVIIRSDRSGVHAGELVEEIDTIYGKDVILKNTIRIYYWSGAASLSQLALEGVKNPNNCKFSVELPENKIMGVIEIIPCTKDAMKNIKGVPTWRIN